MRKKEQNFVKLVNNELEVDSFSKVLNGNSRKNSTGGSRPDPPVMPYMNLFLPRLIRQENNNHVVREISLPNVISYHYPGVMHILSVSIWRGQSK